jgi:hypothetical protein
MGYKVGHNGPLFELLDGDVYVWVVPDEAIYLKAVDRRSRDPVELTPTMARELAAVLLEMAARLDD